MLNKRNLPLFILLCGLGLVVAFRTLGLGIFNPPDKYERILHNIGELLTKAHFSPKKVDDKFSAEIFMKYLTSEKVDPQKNIFLQSDIDALKKFEKKLDDEILGGKVEFVPAVSELYKKRIAEIEPLYKEILSKPFDFSVDETIELDADKYDFPASEAERKERWRKRLKYLTLERYAQSLKARETDTSAIKKTDAELEAEARDKVLQIMNRLYDRMHLKYDDDTRFNEYVRVISESMDPHTTFFPPVDKRYFDEQMSGRFFGIGASLREEDGMIKIASIITGSPAWKSQQLHVGDIILKVAQGDEEPVDLAGYFVEDAVKIIRGTKGTEVRLTVKKTDGSTKVVSLIRDEIIQEDTFARSAVLETESGKIGFIYLPEFYANFEDPNGRRCYDDVRKEIIKLKGQGINGLIMDLRNNGGGSLFDVIQMVGLFIEEGPIVQVKDRDGKPQIYRDRDREVLYDGPLAVMVNEFSASASEIFAAAIQDYQRGVIIGSTSTYGKGTVQRNIGIDRSFGVSGSNSDLGTLKLTLQKFYRINGGSTQLKGVESDIPIPDIFEHTPLREKDNPDALNYDEIEKVSYQPWKFKLNLEPITTASRNRILSNEAFMEIKSTTKWLAEQNEKEVSLNLEKYQAQQDEITRRVRSLENVTKLSDTIPVNALQSDLKRLEYDEGQLERFKAWVKNISTDIYVKETVNVLKDMIHQEKLVYNRTR